MFALPFCGYTLWWIFPILMIILCIFMFAFRIRGRMGPGPNGSGKNTLAHLYYRMRKT